MRLCMRVIMVVHENNQGAQGMRQANVCGKKMSRVVAGVRFDLCSGFLYISF